MPNFDLDGGTSGGKVGYKERCRYVIKRIGLRGVGDCFISFLVISGTIGITFV